MIRRPDVNIADVIRAVEEIGTEPIRIESPGFTRLLFVNKEFDCADGCAFDSPRCHPNSGGYHGSGGRTLLIGVAVPELGAVAFEAITPVYLPSVIDRMNADAYSILRGEHWLPLGSLDFHFANPTDDLIEIDDCRLVDGTCWVTGTTLEAATGYHILVERGIEGVWSWLAEVHLPYMKERSE